MATDTDTLPRIFYGYALRLYFIFKFYFMYIVYIRHRHKLQVIELSSVELPGIYYIDALRQISRDSRVMSDVISSFCERLNGC